MNSPSPRVAIVYPGDRAARESATPDNNRFAAIFRALADLGLSAEPAIYQDDYVDEVKLQLTHVNAVLVWVNPIEGGRDRSVLDAMLRDIAARGIFVSAHPDIILKMGTKQVLYDTRDIGWGCDTHVYRSMDQLRGQLPTRLENGEIRVLKQYRGNGGDGVWKVRLATERAVGVDAAISVRHARRGSVETEMSLQEFFAICVPYFSGSGRMIDQAYQERLPDGMIRCYFVANEVAGFGHQQINALYPAPPGASAHEAPQPGPRLYHPPTKPEFQTLKHLAEEQWVPAMQKTLGIAIEQLPIIWDADFLLGKPDASGQDTYVLCEINVSSVAPFPDSAVQRIAEITRDRIGGGMP
jgi:hypothetical protein